MSEDFTSQIQLCPVTSFKTYFILLLQYPMLTAIHQDRSHSYIKNLSTSFDVDIAVGQEDQYFSKIANIYVNDIIFEVKVSMIFLFS